VSFFEFLGIRWPDQSWELLRSRVVDVREWRSFMAEECGFAPKTLNRRLSSLAGFFQFLREVAGSVAGKHRSPYAGPVRVPRTHHRRDEPARLPHGDLSKAAAVSRFGEDRLL